MILTMMRHGIAYDIGQGGARTDYERRLSPEGEEKTEKIAERLKLLGVAPDLIIHSPLHRTRETAEVVARFLAPPMGLEPVEFLAPGGCFGDFIDYLFSANVTHIMAIGHIPDMPMFTSACIGTGMDIPILFKKAGVAHLSFSGYPGPGRGVLEWLMQPAQLLGHHGR